MATISVSGLANGHYWLVETKTKDGYNLLKAPVEVKDCRRHTQKQRRLK